MLKKAIKTVRNIVLLPTILPEIMEAHKQIRFERWQKQHLRSVDEAMNRSINNWPKEEPISNLRIKEQLCCECKQMKEGLITEDLFPGIPFMCKECSDKVLSNFDKLYQGIKTDINKLKSNN